MYAQADLRLCWLHIPRCWKSHAAAHFLLSVYQYITFVVLILFQVSQITMRERRNSEHVTNDKPESPLALQKMLQVTQRHLLVAVSKMRPSVSVEERMKYKRM